jgi:hypothetical protein
MTLQEQRTFLLSSEPVARLSGEEFARIEGMTLKEQVTAFFSAIGNTSKSVFGDVLLDDKAFKNDSAHGLSREKIASFKAIPQILGKGIAILPMAEHKKGVISGMIAAPIVIAEQEYIAVAVIRGDKNRLYVHEVTLKGSLKEKILESSSNPARVGLQATYQGLSPSDSITAKGNVAKVLQKVISAKF